MNNIDILRRYWFKPNFNGYKYPIPFGCKIGVGITAYDLKDAEKILELIVFKNRSFPVFDSITVDVDISQLDNNHVLPNMNEPINRGVWFPKGYDF